MRIYDPRVGRFLSTDPISGQYPALSSYQFASNSPVAGVDVDGLEDSPFEMMQTEQHIRDYEHDLYKKDPKHADAIIRQHNINAFLFVGGALTGGSGKLATTFWDFVMLAGGTRTVQGLINHNKEQTTEGVHVMVGAAMGEVGGMLIGKTFEIVSPLMRAAGKSLTGTWIKENITGWSESAVQYQEYVTGVKAGQTFKVGDANFDGFRNGKLLEAKSSYDNFVDKATGEFKDWFKISKTGGKSLIDQAERQVRSANGAPIEWDFATQKTLNATKQLLNDAGITGITYKYNPKP